MVVVTLEGVSKRFTLHHRRARSFQQAFVDAIHRRNGSKEDFWALKDVSFDLREGESVGIVGRNGSGKSTILKLITRILEPTKGRIAVHGKVSALIELGAGFHPDLTGRENIFLNGSILGIGRREMQRKFDDIVAFSELEQFLDTPVRHYSSGMYARLGFAVAISVNPRVLIIDEVLAVGDEAFQRKCLERVAEFQAQGVAILFVSHALDSVRRLCSRAIWLEHGMVKMAGDVGSVLDAYAENTVSLPQADGLRSETALGVSADARRWGSREVEIESVELSSQSGQPARAIRSGDGLKVRITYRANKRVDSLVLGMALYSASGTLVAASDTAVTSTSTVELAREGRAELTIDSLPLVNGVYELSIAAYDATRTLAYDHQHRMYRFQVVSGDAHLESGLLRLGCRWQLHPRPVDGAFAVEGSSESAPLTTVE